MLSTGWPGESGETKTEALNSSSNATSVISTPWARRAMPRSRSIATSNGRRIPTTCRSLRQGAATPEGSRRGGLRSSPPPRTGGSSTPAAAGGERSSGPGPNPTRKFGSPSFVWPLPLGSRIHHRSPACTMTWTPSGRSSSVLTCIDPAHHIRHGRPPDNPTARTVRNRRWLVWIASRTSASAVTGVMVRRGHSHS